MDGRSEIKNIDFPNRQKRNKYKKFHNRKFFPECPLCNRSVKFLLTAISVGEDNIPAHFDCVLKKIAETEKIRPREKLTYIGHGNFAVVSGKLGKDLKIKGKIEFEGKENKSKWRKRMSQNLKNLI